MSAGVHRFVEKPVSVVGLGVVSGCLQAGCERDRVLPPAPVVAGGGILGTGGELVLDAANVEEEALRTGGTLKINTKRRNDHFPEQTERNCFTR